MNYICNRDITLNFPRDKIVSDRDLYRIFQNLLDAGYLDPVPDDAYSVSVQRDIFYENGVRLTELSTVREFKEAFLSRGIPYDPLWRREDYSLAAKRWIDKLNKKGVK